MHSDVFVQSSPGPGPVYSPYSTVASPKIDGVIFNFLHRQTVLTDQSWVVPILESFCFMKVYHRVYAVIFHCRFELFLEWVYFWNEYFFHFVFFENNDEIVGRITRYYKMFHKARTNKMFHKARTNPLFNYEN